VSCWSARSSRNSSGRSRFGHVPAAGSFPSEARDDDRKRKAPGACYAGDIPTVSLFGGTHDEGACRNLQTRSKITMRER
jgi:hypothetical protein